MTWLLWCSLFPLLLATARRVSSSDHKPFVATECGPVRGQIEDNVAVFKGIPYAKPPVGSLRWQPPQPLTEEDGCWEGTLRAHDFGSECVQGQGNPQGAEDCLFLNVWSPHSALSGEVSLPVVVWIHGGSLTDGSGNQRGYMPSPPFVKAVNVVAVSLNYRLNVFGFLALDALSQASPTNTSGNYGLRDQIAALTWVKNNIARFGGNPQQVTILGQSAGATCVQGLLVSPLAKGLFQSAVFMSGSAAINESLAKASKDNTIFYTNTGCDNLQCLYKKNAYDMLAAVPWNVYPSWAGGDTWELPTKGLFIGALAVVDGIVIPKPTFDIIQDGEANDVPVVVGSTAQEVDISPKDFSGWQEYNNYVKHHMDTFNPSFYDQVQALYPYNASNSTQTPELLYSTMASDVRVVCADETFAKTLASRFKSPVHRYVLVQGPSPGAQFGSVRHHVRKAISEVGSQYAYHTWDVDALFNFTFPPDEMRHFRPDQTDYGLVTTMQSWFSRFAHNHSLPADWSSYPDRLALMAWHYQVVSSYHTKQCDFFMVNGFAPYAWID